MVLVNDNMSPKINPKGIWVASPAFQHLTRGRASGPFLPRALLRGCVSLSSFLHQLNHSCSFFLSCLQCLHCQMLPTSALEDVSPFCLISCMFLHAFHTSKPVCSLSAFLNISHGLHPPHGQCYESTFVCLKENACVTSVHPSLRASEHCLLCNL